MKKNILKRVTLDTNPEDCNLNCIMCEEHSEYSNFKEQLFEKTGMKFRRMPAEWIENIFEEAKKLGVSEIIPSTMGEPLLYKHIDLFFELAQKYNIKINLTTNGTFPQKSVLEWAKMIIPVTSDTKISLNGATKETAEKIMTGLDFEKQIQNIREFVDYRNQYYRETGYYSRITLQLTFLQNNMHELPEIVKLASELDIDRIKGHHLWTHFSEIEDLSFKNDEKSMEKWNGIVEKTFDTVEKYRKPNGTMLRLEQINYLEKSEKKEVPQDYDCPFLERELWISATGKISPCCAPDEQRNALGDFGNYPKKIISEVLESNIYKDLVKNYKQHPLCKTCVMRKPSINITGNFRDISENNSKLKPGIIFRSALLYHNLGILEMQRLLNQNNITKILDLRAFREVSGYDYDSKTQEKYEIKYIPFDPWAQSPDFKKNQNYGTLTEIAYRFFAMECKQEIKQTLEETLSAKNGILFHCHAGRDRTGIIATILHQLSGASLDVIYTDYLATGDNTKKSDLDIVLNIIEDEGGIENYLKSCNFNENEIQKLKEKICTKRTN